MAVNSSSFSSSLKNLNQNLKELSSLFDKLSSGKRITKAADDAAGMAIASQLSSEAALLKISSRNSSDATSALNIAESAMGQLTDIGTRMNELAMQASNGTLSDPQRAALQEEFSQLAQEAQRITETTTFNGNQLLKDGGFSAQVGTGGDAGSRIELSNPDVSQIVSSLAVQDISTQAGAQQALGAVTSFVSDISAKRGEVGAAVARMEEAGNLADSRRVTTIAAESRISDFDMAKGVAEMTAANIRAQAATALQAQANKLQSTTVLDLLK